METGTGKTLVYIKTIFELYKHYGFTKFIILVPSIAIKEGVLKTFEMFERQLESVYNTKPKYFEYDSKRLTTLRLSSKSSIHRLCVSYQTDNIILNSRNSLYLVSPFLWL